jgi:hypothetical protein
MKVLVHKDLSSESPEIMFVEIEDDNGRSINGDWTARGDGYWEITPEDREKSRLTKLVEVYEWLFRHNSCVGRDATLRQDGHVWVVHDVDGHVVSRGRDAEEAAWGAWDLAHGRGDQ